MPARAGLHLKSGARGHGDDDAALPCGTGAGRMARQCAPAASRDRLPGDLDEATPGAVRSADITLDAIGCIPLTS